MNKSDNNQQDAKNPNSEDCPLANKEEKYPYKPKKKPKIYEIDEYKPKGTGQIPRLKDFMDSRDSRATIFSAIINIYNTDPNAGKYHNRAYIPKYLQLCCYFGIEYYINWKTLEFEEKIICTERRIIDLSNAEKQRFTLITEAEWKKVFNELQLGAKNIEELQKYYIRSIEY